MSSRSWFAAVTVPFVAVALLSCSSGSGTVEMANDPADETVPGPIPTAPPTDDSEGLSSGGAELLAELDALREETDLCRVLTGEAFEQLLSEDFDPASLVTSPAGVTQLVALVDGTFTHLVTIAPPPLRPAMQTIRDVWTQLATTGGSSADAGTRAAEILADPQVVSANESLITWAALNCEGAGALVGSS